MRSKVMKLIAIVLATVFLFTAAACAVGILYCVAFDLYTESSDGDFLDVMTRRLARDFAEMELAKQYGGMEDAETVLLHTHRVPDSVEESVVGIERSARESGRTDVRSFKHYFNDLTYPLVLEKGEAYPENVDYLYEEAYDRVWVDGYYCDYTLLYYEAQYPMYVTVHLQDADNPWLFLAELCYDLRSELPMILLGSLALFLLCMAYLCWAAGKKKGQLEIVPGGLNRLPLDLYALAVCLAEMFLLYTLYEGVFYYLYAHWELPTLALVLTVCLMLLICLLPVCFLFAFAAQVKAKGFWWRRSVIGWCCIRVFRAVRWCWRGLKAVFGMLPVIWQWLLTAAAMVILPAILLIFAIVGYGFFGNTSILLFLSSLLLDVIIVLYGGWCFGTILQAAKAMAQGDLDRKLDTRNLYGSFRTCAENLNTVSEAAMVAARKQMQSERMKTELITNVSHDIKTPLTSIINYVDLLQKPHTEEENTQYLEVLSRQSQRLKKLTEDLVEMSKASTGNVQVELGTVDAGEAVLQALGEFGDKLDAVPLSVVFPQPQAPVMMRADGRLTWRVMSNLLGNAVKYAMPGTRLYANVEPAEGQVRISFKNISRESLNISADELMERFVRGDASRNTEGSGLGLNIAQSLMEVQGGSLSLTVDGDLFKVTLTFPAV